ncbi:hypothetical protein A1QO_15560 [Vibrio genomosp. F10 str. ZF-129]|uniref:Uncharacterized protein n=1 Tax=Vibrio genomosp. F10 str. ZF-129 TaxID=1187848 RepID=A0A1E5BA04_9VIBR|nr:hypothetical protein [Vibrio genomosp. F10]OEE30748.1 hypothetical protein A1QO_15560 [Vibrio genomosp. F10 str. ZF-129]
MTMQTYSDPSHKPCPDLPHHSLNQADKARGLELLKKVKAEFEEMRNGGQTERERRKGIWKEKLKVKALSLPNRVVQRSREDHETA